MQVQSRRIPYALLASLAIHAGLVAWLALRKPPEPPPAAQAPIVVEIVEPPRPKVAAPAVPPVPAAPLAEKSAPAHRKAKPSAPAASQPVNPAPAPSSVAEGEVAVPSGPAVPPAAAAPNIPDLASAGTAAANRVAEQALKLDRPPTLQAPDDRSIQAPFVIDDRNERVAGMLREGLGRDRVERGMVDPYFHELGQKMASQWKPEKLVDEKGMKGFLAEAGRGLKAGATEWVRAWGKAAEAYGKSGNPGDTGGPFEADGRLKENIPPGFTQTMPSQLTSSRIALVRLTQRPDGHLLHVELVQPSIDPVMDAEIMRELRGGEMVMPVPPTRGQGIHNPIRSIWAFQLAISIAPPVPMVTGSFDLEALFDKKMREEMGGLVDVRMPLSRRITKRVDLVSVE